MDNFTFGMSIKNVDNSHEERRFDRADLHAVKSKAGKKFHKADVTSVCVWDCEGTAWLYLKKNTDGSITREERTVPHVD